MKKNIDPLQFIAQTTIPTQNYPLHVRGYRNTKTGHEPIAIVSKLDTFQADDAVPVRVHDACFTSEVLGSLKCDCKGQLDYAIQYIQQHGGVLIYLHQEGRGIGLANKLAAYALQEEGLDTVEANRALHLPDDARDYQDAALILQDLEITDVQLLTNNPRKIEKLREHNIQINVRLPIEIPASPHSEGYLSTKATQMGHLLNISSIEASKAEK